MTMLSETHRELIARMDENGCTDSDLYDFCKIHKVNLKEASRYIAELNAPPQCSGCNHIEMVVPYASMYPCTACSRICKDMYERG